MTTAAASDALFQTTRLIKRQSFTGVDFQQTRPRILYLHTQVQYKSGAKVIPVRLAMNPKIKVIITAKDKSSNDR